MSGRNDGGVLTVSGVDDEIRAANERSLGGWLGRTFVAMAIAYTMFHLLVLNVYPLETWAFRILHVAGGLVLGFILVAARPIGARPRGALPAVWQGPLALGALVLAGAGLVAMALPYGLWYGAGIANPPPPVVWWGGVCLLAGTVAAIIAAWAGPADATRPALVDVALALAAIAVALYLIYNLGALQFRAGVMPTQPDFYVALAGVLLILELTRRMAGLALVVIAAIFIAYAFMGPWLPGFLSHTGYGVARFFTYIYTDNGILGPTTAVSSTYIILFITFGAFLQASKVGEYFVNFAFAVAGRARGGPAKVAVFASGLMGMINGTSAGNVVATGSLTIPLMKKVGYRPQSAAAIEAAASTGGQIMPPIMGAGAFIMAEITGIPYYEISIAALIPALLYFLSVYFMVDFEAAKLGMRGLREDELPRLRAMLKQVYLFAPIVILIGALFMGYSVIRAGTLSLAAAVVVSWLTPHRLGPVGILRALELSARMALQLIAVCACAGIIVGVIGLTGVGLRFSSLLLALADQSQLLALVFAMMISIILGMGMPTTAAYAVAASVVAPGLIQLGIPVLVAHLFVFYYAVISAITPPVALAAYAGAAIAGSDAMRTSVTSFVFGLAAFIVPFMFFFSHGLLLEGDWWIVLRNVATATIGVYLLAGAVQGWLFGRLALPLRAVALMAAISMIEGGIVTDLIGIGLGAGLFLWQRRQAGLLRPPQPRPAE
jgi:TRAP transporter 4TM/12TM fusion protein